MSDHTTPVLATPPHRFASDAPAPEALDAARALLGPGGVHTIVPISWGMMDAFGHVNNVNYFRFFEDARVVYFTALGIDMADAAGGGVGPILASTSCRYRSPVTHPDTLVVGARVTALGEDRFRFEHHIASVSQQQLVTTGESLVVTFDYTTQQKAPIPPRWRERILALDPDPAPFTRR